MKKNDLVHVVIKRSIRDKAFKAQKEGKKFEWISALIEIGLKVLETEK